MTSSRLLILAGLIVSIVSASSTALAAPPFPLGEILSPGISPVETGSSADRQSGQRGDYWNLSLVADLPDGPSDQVEAWGDSALVTSGRRVIVVDFSTPGSPAEIGSIQMPISPTDIAIRGDRAYVCCEGYGLYVIDLSVPAAPEILGQGQGLWAETVYLHGDHAYLPNRWDGIVIVDISVDTDPQIVGSIAREGFQPWPIIAGWDDTLFYLEFNTSTEANYLYSLDVADPFNPVILDSLTLGPVFYPLSISVNDDLLLVNAKHAGQLDQLDLVHVSAVGLLSPLGSYEPYHSIRNAVAGGDFAYLAGNWGITVLDISNTADPDSIDTILFDYDRSITDISLSAFTDRIYASDPYSSMGCHAIDISSPTNPTVIGLFSTWGLCSGVAVREDIAYLAIYPSKVQILDLSSPGNPVPTDTLTLDDTGVGDMVICGDQGFLGGDCLHLLDLAQDPPVVSDRIYSNGSGFDNIEINDDCSIAYGSGRDYDSAPVLKVIDIPGYWQVGELPVPGPTNVQSITRRESYLYLACVDSILVVDVSDPYSPDQVNAFHLGDFPYAKVDGDYLYTSYYDEDDYFYKLAVYGLSNPESPDLLHTKEMYARITDMEFVHENGEHYAYMAYSWSVSVFDIAYPDHPAEIAYFFPGFTSRSVAVKGSTVFAAARENGLIGLDFDPAVGEEEAADDEAPGALMPTHLSLIPNPFNPWTEISFELARAQWIDLAIYDTRGRRLRQLAVGRHDAGGHKLNWDGRDAEGRELPSGLYFLRLGQEDGRRIAATKLTLLR